MDLALISRVLKLFTTVIWMLTWMIAHLDSTISVEISMEGSLRRNKGTFLH